MTGTLDGSLQMGLSFLVWVVLSMGLEKLAKPI